MLRLTWVQPEDLIGHELRQAVELEQHADAREDLQVRGVALRSSDRAVGDQLVSMIEERRQSGHVPAGRVPLGSGALG